MRRDDTPHWADDPKGYLATLGQGPESGFDAGAAALAFAALDRPKAAHGRYLDHLDKLAEAASLLPASDAVSQVRALSQVIYEDFGYAGDTRTYDDMQNASLIRVIDRKKGLPVALGILHMSIAYRLDWSIVGLSFPSHFLLRVEAGGERLSIDPFDDGQILGAADMRRLLKNMLGPDAELTAEHYQPVSDRAVLLRLQNNIKIRRLRAGDIQGGLRSAEAMAAFAPEITDLVREIAMMHMRLENIGDAIRHFETYLDAEPNETLRHKVTSMLQELKNRLN
jgi:regulator of sirC expression with transglutaminase-like and TPR domain